MMKALKSTLTTCTLIMIWGLATAKLPPAAQVYTTTSALGGGAPLRGVVLSGASGQMNPNYHGIAYTADAEPLIYKGFNTFRIPVTWEALSNNNKNGNWMIDKGADNQYYQQLINLITNLTKIKNVHVIIDLHNYFRYGYPCPKGGSGCDNEANNNTNGVLGSGNGTPGLDPYIALWQDIYNTVSKIEVENHNPDSVIFELMNEPYFFDDDNRDMETLLATFYHAVIEQIHKEDPKRTFMVDGDEWAGMHRFDMHDPDWIPKPPIGGPIQDLIYEIDHDQSTAADAADIRAHLIIDVHDYFWNLKRNSNGDYGIDGCSDQVNNIRRQEQAMVDFCNATAALCGPSTKTGVDIHCDNTGVRWLMGEVNVPDYDKDQRYVDHTLKPMCKKDMEAALQYAHTNEPTYAGFTLQASGHLLGPDSSGNFSPGTCKYTGNYHNISYLPSDSLFDTNSYLNETIKGTRILNDLPAILWPKVSDFPVKYIIHNKSDYTLNIDSDSSDIVGNSPDGAGVLHRNWLIPHCNHIEPLKGIISMPDNNFEFYVGDDKMGLHADGSQNCSCNACCKSAQHGNEVSFTIEKPQSAKNIANQSIVVDINNGSGTPPKPPQDLPDIPSQPYTPRSAPYPGLKYLHAQSR